MEDTNYKEEENKLLAEVTPIQGSITAKDQIATQAKIDGYSDEEVMTIVRNVLNRLNHVGTGAQGNAFAKAHDAKDEHKAIKEQIGALHGY